MGNEQELESHIKSLEDEQEKTHRFFKYTLTTISGIFALVGVLFAVMSIFSKTEVSNAVRDMERKFEVLQIKH